MSTITELIVKDHERFNSLFNDFKNTKNKDPKKANKLFDRFRRELKEHFTIEEEAYALRKRETKYN